MTIKCLLDIEEKFPMCKEHNPALFEEVAHSLLIMCEVSEKMNVPMEEMMEFFYKGKLKLDLIKEQEEELEKYGRKENSVL